MSELSQYISRLSIAGGGTNTLGTIATVSNGVVVFAGGTNITLSQSSNTISIVGAAGGAGGVAISGGAQSQSTGTIIFSNSNGVSFGLTDGTMTASVAPSGSPLGVGAGAETVTSGTIIFSNSNGIAFGMNNSTLTASYTVPTVPAQLSLGASTGGNTAGTTGLVTGQMVFVGGNGVTLSQSANGGSATLTMSVANLPRMGVSTLGNTAGNTGTVFGSFILAGGNNITLSGSTNGQSMTVTVSGPNTVAQTVQTQNLIDVTLAGNSTSSGAGYILISSGTMTLAGGNNITLSQNGNAVTISAANTVAQSNQTVGGYFSSQTTGQSSSRTFDARSLTFVGMGNISVGASAGSILISGSGGAGDNFSAGISTQGNTSGTTGFVGSQIQFVGTNGITLSQSVNGASATITVSGLTTNSAPNFGIYYPDFVYVPGQIAGGGGGGAAISAAGASQSAGTIVFSNANNVSFGMAGSTVTASATVAGLSAGVSNLGSTAGDTGLVTGQLVLAGVNGIMLSGSTNGASMTISIDDQQASQSVWEPNPIYANTSYSSFDQNSLYLLPLRAPNPIVVSYIQMSVSLNNATSSNSHAKSQTMSYALYQRGAGANSTRLESIASSSLVFRASYSSNLSGGYTISQGTNSTTYSSAGTGSTSAWTGQRVLQLPFTTTLAEAQLYVLGFAQSTASVGNVSAFMASHMVMTGQSNQSFGALLPSGNSISSATALLDMPHGFIYTSTSNAWPVTIGSNSISIQSGIRPAYVLGIFS